MRRKEEKRNSRLGVRGRIFILDLVGGGERQITLTWIDRFPTCIIGVSTIIWVRNMMSQIPVSVISRNWRSVCQNLANEQPTFLRLSYDIYIVV